MVFRSKEAAAQTTGNCGLQNVEEKGFPVCIGEIDDRFGRLGRRMGTSLLQERTSLLMVEVDDHEERAISLFGREEVEHGEEFVCGLEGDALLMGGKRTTSFDLFRFDDHCVAGDRMDVFQSGAEKNDNQKFDKCRKVSILGRCEESGCSKSDGERAPHEGRNQLCQLMDD